MARPPATRADDERVLMMLHLMDGEGMSAGAVGKRYGISRSAVLGYRYRALVDLEKSEEGAEVTKPENKDGAMGPLWWRK